MKKPYSAEEAYNKMASACVTKEMCPYDVARKLRQWGLDEGLVREVVARLEREKFVDESRYVKAFVHDKVMFERWGRQKIRQALALKKIGGGLVDEALSDIDLQLYMENLKALLQQKSRSLHEDDAYLLAQKLMRFAAGRGYTFEEIKQCVNTDFDM